MAINAKNPVKSGTLAQRIAWYMWDAGGASVNAVATTFVFTVYLTSASFGNQTLSSQAVSIGMTISGVIVALTAPITGQRADLQGKGTFWLMIFSAVVVVCLAAMFLVAPHPHFLWLGVGLLAVMTMFFEFASVNYYAMLPRISDATNVGRVSGIGWASGYFGGIILLMFLNFGFITENNFMGVNTANGMGVRMAMLVSALWSLLLFAPVVFAVPGRALEGSENLNRDSILDSYRRLIRTIVWLFRYSPSVAYFLIASAIFRDGLSGVFTFGGIIAAVTFGFTPGEVILFAVAANVIAGVSTSFFGVVDDKIGPKKVMVASLASLTVSCVAVFLLHDYGKTVFWIFALFMCIWVGPAQSASRSFLARRIPEGHEGEVFGLYQTTGRSVTWLAPLMFSLFITIGSHLTPYYQPSLTAVTTGVAGPMIPIHEQSQYWGILGLAMVLLVGLLLLLPVKETQLATNRNIEEMPGFTPVSSAVAVSEAGASSPLAPATPASLPAPSMNPAPGVPPVSGAASPLGARPPLGTSLSATAPVASTVTPGVTPGTTPGITPGASPLGVNPTPASPPASPTPAPGIPPVSTPTLPSPGVALPGVTPPAGLTPPTGVVPISIPALPSPGLTPGAATVPGTTPPIPPETATSEPAGEPNPNGELPQ